VSASGRSFIVTWLVYCSFTISKVDHERLALAIAGCHP
jgi:hypothetical protein